MLLEFRRSSGAAVILALSALLAAPADAAITGYTDSAAFLAATGTLTTDGFEEAPPWANPLSEPVESMDASYESTQTLEVNIGGGRAASNGITDQDSVPQVLDSISINLPANVVAVGGWVQTFGLFQADDIVLTAYDDADLFMGSVTLFTDSSNDFRFVGLVSDEPIARVEFESTGSGGALDDDFVLDDFSVEIVASGPLPAPLLAPWQLALFGAGLVLLARRFG